MTARLATRSSSETVMDDRWLSVDDICAYLGVSRDTIYSWIANKAMPAQRVGRLWKFKKEEVDAWVRTGGAAEGTSNRAGGSENGN